MRPGLFRIVGGPTDKNLRQIWGRKPTEEVKYVIDSGGGLCEHWARFSRLRSLETPGGHWGFTGTIKDFDQKIKREMAGIYCTSTMSGFLEIY